jgi:hypothetical protein
VRIVQVHTISRLGRMFMARLHRRALACLGFWVGRLLDQRGEGPRVNPRPWQTESRRSKAQLEFGGLLGGSR